MTGQTPEDNTATGGLQARNRRMMMTVSLVVCGMIGLSFASVPLYDLFCRVTGFGGTTQTADVSSDTVIDREMTIRFDASIGRNLPWSFQPVEREMTLKVGENGLAYYRATNISDKPVKGTASFNVTPLKAGQYFVKVECFCFTEQLLEPGQSIDMPVAFFVEPALDEDINLDEVKTITLSYTFFPMDDAEQVAAHD